MKRVPFKRKARKKRSKPFKTLTPHRKLVQARKALRKAYKRKYGTKSALKRADVAFSALIRKRDGKCQFPGCEITDFAKLQNSHYISRSVSETRFDEDNCIALCWNHHYFDKMLGWEYQKQRLEEHGWDGRYTLHMRTILGEKRFNDLLERAKITTKRTEAIRLFLERISPPELSTFTQNQLESKEKEEV